METDEKVPIILGRPFLKTARALIDMDEGKLHFRLGDDEIVFDINRLTKQPADKDDVYCVEMLAPHDISVQETFSPMLGANSSSSTPDAPSQVSPLSITTPDAPFQSTHSFPASDTPYQMTESPFANGQEVPDDDFKIGDHVLVFNTNSERFEHKKKGKKYKPFHIVEFVETTNQIVITNGRHQYPKKRSELKKAVGAEASSSPQSGND